MTKKRQYINKNTHTINTGKRVSSGQFIIMTNCGYSVTTKKRRYKSGFYMSRKNNLPVAKHKAPSCLKCLQKDIWYLRIPRYLKYLAYRLWDRMT